MLYTFVFREFTVLVSVFCLLILLLFCSNHVSFCSVTAKNWIFDFFVDTHKIIAGTQDGTVLILDPKSLQIVNTFDTVRI